MPAEHRVPHRSARPAPARARPSRNRRPSSSMTGAIRSSSAATDSLHVRHPQGRQGGVGHGRKLYRQRARPPPRSRDLDGGYSRGHASPAVAAACPRGGGGDTRTAAPAVAAADEGDATAPSGTERLAVASRSQARTDRPGAEPADPLLVTIDEITPSYLPARGPCDSPGSVTNRSQDTWTAINLHAFIGVAADHHQRRAGRGRRRSTRPSTSATGSLPRHLRHRRRAGAGPVVVVLHPGPAVRARATTRPGVYWFGVHALGDSAVAPRRHRRRPGPHVPARWSPTPQAAVDTALVIPLRRQVQLRGRRQHRRRRGLGGER